MNRDRLLVAEILALLLLGTACLVHGQTATNVYLPDSPVNTFPDGSPVWPVIDRELRYLMEKIAAGTFLPEHFPHVINDYYPGRLNDHAGIIKLLTDSPRYIQQLPPLAGLVLQLHEVITTNPPVRPIYLLWKNEYKTLTFTQQQISVLLASAFFCGYPKREAPWPDFVGYPYPNFFGLFKDARSSNLEKLKFFFNYFEQIGKRSGPGTVITYERRTLIPSQVPNWAGSTKPLSPTRITAEGTIEDDGVGMLQVVFANKMVGGGILGTGATQEEIRFSINPELLASLLFTQELADDEVLIVTGTERFSNYTGYSSTLQYAGGFTDTLPVDGYGRRQTQVVLMDALQFSEGNAHLQFLISTVNRELKKAFSAFLFRGTFETPIATGKWGAGVYNGNPLAKFLIQLMAASEAEREITLFTFGDAEQAADWTRIYERLVATGATVGRLHNIFVLYSREVNENGPDAIPFETFVENNI